MWEWHGDEQGYTLTAICQKLGGWLLCFAKFLPLRPSFIHVGLKPHECWSCVGSTDTQCTSNIVNRHSCLWCRIAIMAHWGPTHPPSMSTQNQICQHSIKPPVRSKRLRSLTDSISQQTNWLFPRGFHITNQSMIPSHERLKIPLLAWTHLF